MTIHKLARWYSMRIADCGVDLSPLAMSRRCAKAGLRWLGVPSDKQLAKANYRKGWRGVTCKNCLRRKAPPE